MPYSSKNETAFKWQPGLSHGCQVHAVLCADAEVVEVVRRIFMICQHTLDPGLALRTCIADQCWPKSWSNIIM